MRVLNTIPQIQKAVQELFARLEQLEAAQKPQVAPVPSWVSETATGTGTVTVTEPKRRGRPRAEQPDEV